MMSRNKFFDFEYIFLFVLENEERYGYQNFNPLAKIKFGITEKNLRKYQEKLSIRDSLKTKRLSDISEAEARYIYHDHYWVRNKGDMVLLRFPMAAKVYLDALVQSSPRLVKKQLQSAINVVFEPAIKVDGILGERTFEALSIIGENFFKEELLYEFSKIRTEYFILLCQKALRFTINRIQSGKRWGGVDVAYDLKSQPLFHLHRLLQRIDRYRKL